MVTLSFFSWEFSPFSFATVTLLFIDISWLQSHAAKIWIVFSVQIFYYIYKPTKSDRWRELQNIWAFWKFWSTMTGMRKANSSSKFLTLFALFRLGYQEWALIFAHTTHCILCSQLVSILLIWFIFQKLSLLVAESTECNG